MMFYPINFECLIREPSDDLKAVMYCCDISAHIAGDSLPTESAFIRASVPIVTCDL